MTPEEQDHLLDEAKDLSFALQRLLKGKNHDAVQAALIDVMSVWIAGHMMVGKGEDPLKGPWSKRTLEKTRQHRMEALSMMVQAIEALVDISAAERGLPHSPIDKDPERWAAAHFQRH